jgi:hypothetical protein
MRRGKGKRRCCSVGETFLFGGVCKITGQGVISGPEREPPVRAARHPGTGPLEIRGAKGDKGSQALEARNGRPEVPLTLTWATNSLKAETKT